MCLSESIKISFSFDDICSHICNDLGSCSTLELATGMSVSITTDGSISTANYSCTEGYTLVGSPAIPCRSNGDWVLSPPSCSMYSYTICYIYKD